MYDCVFCNIANKTQPAEMLFENDELFVVKDIMPKAPVHLLVIPKRHIISINEVYREDSQLIADMVLTAKAQAEATGISATGYKLVWNVGKHGGQIIPHLHLHVLGGKQLDE